MRHANRDDSGSRVPGGITSGKTQVVYTSIRRAVAFGAQLYSVSPNAKRIWARVASTPSVQRLVLSHAGDPCDHRIAVRVEDSADC